MRFKSYSIATALCCYSLVHATDYNWNTVNGNWNVPSNWNPNGFPNAQNDIADFNNQRSSSFTVDLQTDTFTLGFLRESQSNFSSNPNLTLQNGTLNFNQSNNNGSVGSASQNITFNANGGSLTFNTSITSSNSIFKTDFAGPLTVNFNQPVTLDTTKWVFRADNGAITNINNSCSVDSIQFLTSSNMTVNGFGIDVLSSANDAITLSGGTIEILEINMDNQGGITCTQNSTIGDPSGAVTINSPGSLVITSQANAELSMINTSISSTATVQKSGNGILSFIGLNLIPNLTINAGTVNISGSLTKDTESAGQMIIASGATLQGIGYLGNGSTPGQEFDVTNHGTMRPGSDTTAGTLILGGSYHQEIDGALSVRSIGNTISELVVGGGPITLHGAFDFVQDRNSTITAGVYTVLDGTNATDFSGTFRSNSFFITPALTPTLIVNTPEQIVEINFSNTINAATVQDTAAQTSVGVSFQQLYNVSQNTVIAVNLMNNFSNNVSSNTGILNLPMAFEKTKDGKTLQELTLFASADTDAAVAMIADAGDSQYNEGYFGDAFYGTIEQPVTLYAAPIGSWGNVDSTSKQKGYNFHALGVLLGGNYTFCWGGLGAQLGYESTHGKIHSHLGKFRLESLFGTLYSRVQPFKTPIFLDVIVDFGGNWYDMQRSVFAGEAKSKTKGWQGDGFVGLGYDYRVNRWRIQPLAALQYVYLHSNGYSEHGGSLEDMKFKGQNIRSLRTWLGMSADARFNTDCTTWIPQVRGYWIREYAETNHRVTIAATNFPLTSQISVFGGKRNYGIVGAELRVNFATRWTAAASYDYYWNSDVSDNMAYAELGVRF